jgi:hypothetical protein
MSKQKAKEETFVCPVGKFLMDLEKSWEKKSTFMKHMNQSRVEFLKAMRSLLDDRIENLEKRGSKKNKKMTKIDVE